MNYNYHWQKFPNIGYITTKFDDAQLKPIWNEVDKIKDDFNSYKPFNDELAGNISKEFEITKDTWSYIEKLVSPLIGIYEKEFEVS